MLCRINVGHMCSHISILTSSERFTPIFCMLDTTVGPPTTWPSQRTEGTTIIYIDTIPFIKINITLNEQQHVNANDFIRFSVCCDGKVECSPTIALTCSTKFYTKTFGQRGICATRPSSYAPSQDLNKMHC